MNKGRWGRKRKLGRRWPRTSRATFDKQERAIERKTRQDGKDEAKKGRES